MGIPIQRRIAIKTRVTEDWKRRVASDVQESLKGLEEDLGRLEQEARRIRETKHRDRADALSRGIALEKQKRLEQREALLQRLRDIVKLEPGTKVLEGSVEGPVEIREGDDWSRVMSAEVVLENGIVVSIRGAPS